MRSGLRLFIFLSISLLSDTCCLRSCSSFLLLSWISFTRDFRRSELLWILRWRGMTKAGSDISSKGGERKEKRGSGRLLLDLLLVAFPLESLQRLSAVALLGLALFLEDLDGLVEGLDGCALHLQLLHQRQTFSLTRGRADGVRALSPSLTCEVRVYSSYRQSYSRLFS